MNSTQVNNQFKHMALRMLEDERKDALIAKTDIYCVICNDGPIDASSIYYPHRYYRNNNGTIEKPSMAPYVRDGESTVYPGFSVCSEICRKKYVASHLSYSLLMRDILVYPEGGYDYIFIVPQRYVGKTLELWNVPENPAWFDTYQKINEWLITPHKGWIICGNVGSGKSTLASAIAYELRKQEKTVKWVDARTLSTATMIAARSWKQQDLDRFY